MGVEAESGAYRIARVPRSLTRAGIERLARAMGDQNGQQVLLLAAEDDGEGIFCLGAQGDVAASWMAGRLACRILGAPGPTIALVDGAAVGLGIGLAICCDLVVATTAARFDPFDRVAGGHASSDALGALLEPRMGRAAVQRWLAEGKAYGADEASAHGLVDLQVPTGEAHAVLEREARKLARQRLAVLRQHSDPLVLVAAVRGLID